MKSKKKLLRLGIVQLTSVDDVSKNVVQILKALKKLKEKKCDLICLPENALYLRLNKSDKIVEFNFKEKFWSDFQSFADENDCAILVGSLPVRRRIAKNIKQKSNSDEKLSNATVMIEPRTKPRVVYEKIHLFDVDVSGAPPQRESDSFNHGAKPSIITYKGWRMGLSICYDLRFSELYNFYARKHVDLILIPAAFLVPTGKMHWNILIKARAIESQCFVAAAAQCGSHKNSRGDHRETFGNSLVIDPWGVEMLCLGDKGSRVGVVVLNPAQIEVARRQIPMSKHRRFKL